MHKSAVTANPPDAEVSVPENTETALFQEVQPWGGPVSGPGMFDNLVNAFRRHVVLSVHEAVAAALWTVFTFVHMEFNVLPLLAIVSPTRGCGKTVMLRVLKRLVNRPHATSSTTAAALFRLIDAYCPTVLIDEADTFLAADRPLRGVVNSGHVRDTGCVMRTVNGKAQTFNLACPKALAQIGCPPDTIMQRAIPINLRRKAAGEQISPLDSAAEEVLHGLARRAARWAVDNGPSLHDAKPEIPQGIRNRAEDNWGVLLAIAEAIGGRWPKAARAAAVALTASDDGGDVAIGETLIRDIQTIVQGKRAGSLITSADLVRELVKREDRPWPEFSQGRPITTARLARILRPFGIIPGVQRVGVHVVRGYRLEQFADAFQRYGA